MENGMTYGDITNNDPECTPYLRNFKPWEQSFAGKENLYDIYLGHTKRTTS